jgi:hypothetical protein
MVTIDFATKALELAIPHDHPATRRWVGVIAARPSYVA